MNYFIDFEATQFSNDIISIGCIDENGEEFYSLINPGEGKLTSFITELTGITDEMLNKADSLDIILKNIVTTDTIGEINTILDNINGEII